MNTRVVRITMLLSAALSLAAFSLQAAPSLPITEPPVSSLAPDGPPQDPASTNGQWFLLTNGDEVYRTHEFYDNMPGHGGGINQWLSIEGKVTSITTNAAGSIVRFDVDAWITNDTASGDEGQESSSSNSHQETRPAGTERYVGTLRGTKLTAEFAIADLSTLPGMFNHPYRDNAPYIIADNEDQLAWYCWTQGDPPEVPPGSYYVPAWEFGDIPVGQPVLRTLNFSCNPVLPSSDPRHGVIFSSRDQSDDIFANRTSSLKISTWIDNLGADNTFQPYPDENLRSSNVSVFHDETEPYNPTHKMHHPQLPDPNGWDVRACYSEFGPDTLKKVLADDFLCTSNGPITKITFWGSFRYDDYLPTMYHEFHGIDAFHFSLHSDIPDPDGLQGPLYSMPEVPALWEKDINPLNPPTGWTITVTPEDPSPQGWYDPNNEQNTDYPNHANYFRYEVTIPTNEAFVQVEGTIYWLDISANVFESLEWGWKTTTNHWNDDAVWADLPVVNTNQWNELRDPYTFESLDLAFVIDGGDEIPQEDLDWGDAPDPTYPTLAASLGASHIIVPGVHLGLTVDPETDGQQSPNADGDDLLDGNDDEDGVFFPTRFIPNVAAAITVRPSVPGYLNAWIDLNLDGDWADAGEWIFADLPVSAGINNIGWLFPPSALPGQTFARFRFTTQSFSGIPGLNETGQAPDGEVEDYSIVIDPDTPLDWGDAPNGPYPTFLLSGLPAGGARHAIIPGMFLGGQIDLESNGQPSPVSDGDDAAGIGDEDGIVFTTVLQPGGAAGVDVIASQPGTLDAWADFNNDGDWDDSGERIFTGQPLVLGVNSLYFPVETSATPGNRIFTRWRYSSTGVADYKGFSPDGEVEDHLTPPIDPIDAQSLDWGDADLPYPTIMANNGARHVIVPGVVLGATIDSESDGQPTPLADGDDLAGPMPDDEDGVTFIGSAIAGSNVTVNVVAGASGGVLDAWLDFNNDLDWADPGEHLFGGSTNLPPGLSTLSFTVPGPPAVGLGPAAARFRISSAGSLPPGGPAPDGEVEDYMVELYQPSLSTNIVITNIVVTAAVAQVEWTAQNLVTYQLENSTNLVIGPWNPVGGTVIGPTNWQTNPASLTQEFFRVTAPWTP